MLSVGKTLKRARLAQGLDVSTVAAQTKISSRYLEAIESDDRGTLPSGFFYKSFVDQYAKYLSLDTQEIAAEIDRMLSADGPLPLPGVESVVARNVPPMTFAHSFHAKRSYMTVASLVLVIAGCSGVYAWWKSARSSINLKGMIENVRGLTKAKPGSTQSMPAVPKVIADTPAPKQTIAQPAAPPVSVASDPKDTEAPETTIASPAPAAGYKVLLDLMAHEATWLSVSSDGKPVFSGILKANETKSVGGKQFAKMRVGNAAGLEVRLNGKLLGPLGARGQVLTVLFTPDNFQIFSPPKESD